MTRIDPRFRSAGPQNGDVWLAKDLPFADGINSKSRPVVIKGKDGDRFRCFKCTTKKSEFRPRYEVIDLIEAGLEKGSFIDYEPILISRSKLSYKMGSISALDRAQFGML